MKTIYVDSGFLIALYGKPDEYTTEANNYFNEYFKNTLNKLVIPCPILFETVSTKMVRHRKGLELLEKDWKTLKAQQRLVLLNDLDYREKALEECFKESQKDPRSYRSLSLVDRVIRNMLSDVSLRIDYFITFNIKDFEDVCKKFRRILIGDSGDTLLNY